jgi:signal transduction histidine kinase
LGLYYFNEKKYDKVIPFATKGYEALKGFQVNKNSRTFTTYALDHLKLLVESYAKLNEFEKAFQAQNTYNELKNSTLEAELESKLHDLNEKYKTEQKEITITKLENENLKNQTSKRNQLILLLTLLLVVGSGSIFFVSKKNQQLVLKNNELNLKNKEITEALLKGQTIERRRMAMDLHDNLGSTLSALWYSLENVSQEDMKPEKKEIHQNIKNTLQQAYNEVRLLSHNLLPEEFEKLGLVLTLKNLFKNLNKNSKIEFQLSIPTNFKRIDHNIEFQLYSICLELLTNIKKHSMATQASIRFSENNNTIFLEVKDNGIGFRNENNRGRGMKNIMERTKSIHGEIAIDSINGTTIQMKVHVNSLSNDV